MKSNILMNPTNLHIQLNGKAYSRETIHDLAVANEPHDSWRNAIFHFLENWFDDSSYVLVQTSGSTGKPKSIQLSKTSIERSARMTNNFFGLNTKSQALLCLPASYIAGKMMIVRAVMGGYNLIAAAPAANPFQNLNANIDFAAITPYQLYHSIESLKSGHIKQVIVGGGAVSPQLETMSADIPTKLFETYGMTETCSHIALRQFNGSEKSEYFHILQNIQIHQDERGCLAIKAPNLLDSEIQTNDIVEIRDANSFKWIGRADNVINSGGVKIHPELIERKIADLFSDNYFVASFPDTLLQNKVVLFIETEQLDNKDIASMLDILSQKLDKYEMPKEIIGMKQFIYSPNNKILRLQTLENWAKDKR